MSKYTTEVRFICETYAGLTESVGYSKVEEILDETWDKVFDFTFPIFDEEYRNVLCKKILKHYYTREIGFETVALWKLKLSTAMNEIMPYFNQMYKSTLIEFNPLYDADYTKTHEGEDTGNGSESGKRTGSVDDTGHRNGGVNDRGTATLSETTWDVYSDTPQGALTNVDNNTYLTNARKVTHDASNVTTNDRTYHENTTDERNYNENNDLSRSYKNSDEYIDHVVGKFPGKSYPSLIKEFRESFLNIDMDVINALGNLFLKLW